jgi:hypothetical protein
MEKFFLSSLVFLLSVEEAVHRLKKYSCEA